MFGFAPLWKGSPDYQSSKKYPARKAGAQPASNRFETVPKPVCRSYEAVAKPDFAWMPLEMIKQRGAIMSALLNLIYREYCLARLAEMRRQHRGVAG